VSERLQVLIAGAGPAGLAAGVQAARRGLRHAVLERAEFANTIHRYQRGKHVMDEPADLTIQAELAMAFEAGSREGILERWQQDTRQAGVNILRGAKYEVTGISGAKGSFTVTLRDGSTLEAENVVLAIGTQGNLRTFGVPGDDLAHVTYQLDDPAELVGKRAVVVGAGDAGIENALALIDENDVVLVNRREEFYRAKARNRMMVEASVKSGDLTLYPNTVVKGFTPESVTLHTDSGELQLKCDRVIGRLGALPPREFLEAIGIRFPSEERTAVPQVSPTFESNVPGIYLIGALVGRPLIKSCMNGGFEVIEHILGNRPTPADEPLLRRNLGNLPGTIDDIIERIRTRIPVFSSLTPIELREFLVDSQVHVKKKGEVVFQRNDFTDTFYTILEGSVNVIVPLSNQDADSDLKEELRNVRHVLVGQGAFFGEGSLLSGRRRSATIEAASDSILIETERLAMQKLIKSAPQVKQVIDLAAIRHGLEDLAPTITADERESLAAASVIKSFQPGEVLCAEGDEPDGLHILRRGFVVISRLRDGHEQVINYVQAGNYVGEVALVKPKGRRSATVKAMVLTETILVPTHAILQITEAHPELREGFERRGLEQSLQGERALGHGTNDLVDFLITKGGKEATDLLLINESLCIRCDQCEVACAETHHGVSRLNREAGPRYADVHLPTACQHCENPKCMLDCPPDAIRRHPNAEVYILDTCIGCGNCATNCPYDVIQMAVIDEQKPPSLLLSLLFGAVPWAKPAQDSGHARHEVAVKCDLCRNLPGRQHGESRAACVASCPTGAIVRVKPGEYIEEILEGQNRGGWV